MTASVSLNFKGDDILIRALGRLSDPAKKKDLLEQIGARGVFQTQQRFLDQKGPDGQPWKKSLRAIESSGETLRHKNRLFSSFTFAATASSVEWGTNVIYAGIHHFGGVIKPKNKKALAFRGAGGNLNIVKQVTMPARPFLGLTDADRADIAETYEDWMKGAWA